MKQEVVQTSSMDVDRAVIDIVSKLSKSAHEYNVIIFFAAAEYDFPALAVKIKECFPKAEVLGASAPGEITPKGFIKQSLVVTALSCSKTSFQGVLIDNIDKFPIIDKSKLEQAALKCGISINSASSHKDAFALTFVNGVRNAEESFLSFFHAVIKNDQFIIAGGSAGDNLEFKKTYISYNGTVTVQGAVVLFIKTRCVFDVRKVNIFKSTGKRMTITKADMLTRTIYELDGQNAKRYYCKNLGIPESQVDSVILDHPLGRNFNNKLYISSITGFTPSGAINVFTRVVPNTIVDILEPADTLQILSDNLAEISKKVPRFGCAFIIPCLLCTIGFEKYQLCSKITDLLNKTFPTFCGFSGFGEQFGKLNNNQTIIMVVIGE
ncbi:MAG: FIST signal transduction protein [Treponema sp.]